MCAGIALAWSELPTELIGRHRLDRRAHERGGEKELRFLFDDRDPRLPVRRDGQFQIVRWGNQRGQSHVLPRTGWTWQEAVERGEWLNLGAVPVEIPATLGMERGVWYRIRGGLRGLVVPDENGVAVAYVICEPASHYYRVMTRSDRMPVIIGERI
jgi:hypothetical protein